MFLSITQLLEQTTKEYGSLPALSLKSGFRTKTYTYQEIYDFINKFSSFFAKHGIEKNDRIIVLSFNRPEYVLLLFGAFTNSIIIVPIDYRTNQETIEKFIKEVEPKAIFTSVLFKNFFKDTKILLFFLEDLTAELATYESSELSKGDPNQLAAILFTSGTTGEPKGSMILHKNMLASLNNVRKVFTLPTKLRILSLLPLSHALEMIGGFMTAFSFGCHIHYIERVNSITIIKALRLYKIEAMAVVPQMLRILLQSIERRVDEEGKRKVWEKGHAHASAVPFFVRRLLFGRVHASLGGSFLFFVCGSAPLEEKLARIWENMGISVLEGYGASETTGIVSTNSRQHNTLGTVGKIIPGVSYKRLEAGELLVSGENIIGGYYQNSEKTKEAFVNGWFKTGDIVSFDSQNNLIITGRDKFKIVLPDGKKVYPEDVEKKLNNHPAVADSCVFGLRTVEGEIVHAEVILKKDAPLDSIIKDVNTKLNPHEQILDFSRWSEDDFPRTKTLKVDREALRQRALAKTKGTHGGQVPEEKQKDKLLDILATVSGRNGPIAEDDVLATGLKFDSLKRIELLALIEEDMGISVDELRITPKTTVSDLRHLVKEGKPTVISDGEKLNEWQFTSFTSFLRVTLQDVFSFPLFNIGFKIKVIHPENMQKIKTPSLFIFNHVGVYDIMNILRVLPRDIRKKIAIAATADLWHEVWYHKYFAVPFANAFPFVKAESHHAMRGNFDRVGELLDRGFNILISPEGNVTHTGQLLPFHTGAGYIAVEMGVPVTPFKILGYYELWPEEKERALNLFWPKKFGKVEVIVGEPITFSKGTSYEEATEILRQEIIHLDLA